MTGTIRIEFDTETGKILLDAPLNNQQQKDLTVKVLAASIPIVVNYEQSIILKPTPNGNGASKPPIIPKAN